MTDDAGRPALTVETHAAAVRAAADALATRAAEAGLAARVPTCPAWRVADLVAHQGMVHRWAASNLRLDTARVPSKTEILRTIPRTGLLAWFADGANELASALAAAAPDVPAMVFLKDAPAPRAFWARRQAHETTIHAVDALAAGLGRRPTAAEAAIPAELALDGVDELLTGFVTRGRNRFCDDDPFRVAVIPDDAVPDDAEPDGLAWLLHVGPGGIETERTTPAGATDRDSALAPDAVFRGSAAQLYLGLWNRGDEVAVEGRDDLLERWVTRVHVTWS